MLVKFDAEKNTLTELHLFIDRLQEKLIDLDGAIGDFWFALQPR